jgi:hypothetical protein
MRSGLQLADERAEDHEGLLLPLARGRAIVDEVGVS